MGRLIRAFAAALLGAVLTASDCGEGTVNNDSVSVVTTVRVSLGANGAEPNEASHDPSISADGRYVAFSSTASNLHPDDVDNISDIFVRDLVANTTILVSRATGAAGVKGNKPSFRPQISFDGRYVVFESLADNLHADDPAGNLESDIYLRDLVSSTTILVSRDSGASGTKLTQSMGNPRMSPDGRYIAFFAGSGAMAFTFLRDMVTFLNENYGAREFPFPSPTGFPLVYQYWPTAAGRNIYLRPNATGLETLVSKAPYSTAPPPAVGDGDSMNPSFSGDGNYIVFESTSSDLIAPGLDTNKSKDIFLCPVATLIIGRVSLTNSGTEAAGGSYNPCLSQDARFVAFASDAANMVNGDTNGVGDIFVRDLLQGGTQRVSVRTYGGQASDASDKPAISADGRWVAFESRATDMVGGDDNNATDIFIRGPLR